MYSVCTVNKNAVSHVFEKRDTGETYKSGQKAGEKKLSAALLPGEFRTAVATVPDPREPAAKTIQARPATLTLTLTLNFSPCHPHPHRRD